MQASPPSVQQTYRDPGLLSCSKPTGLRSRAANLLPGLSCNEPTVQTPPYVCFVPIERKAYRDVF
jgi:hypothetical protein